MLQPARGGSLNDQLAIERTLMANDRTLLSFIRTALYFVVAGLTLTQLVSLRYGFLLQALFFALAIITLSLGVHKYRQQLLRIRHIRNQLHSRSHPGGQATDGNK